MKKVMYLFIVSIALCTGATAQTELTFKSSMISNGGVFKNGNKLKTKEVREVMSENSKALGMYNSGRSLFVAGQVIAYPCAFLLGFDLGTRIGGG
ncbi:MAG: hypothetical protein LBE79_12080 [Tannerella sp.]|jgi:hypothetical protein|nr:hypothetical protein [Tannerella sp.]